MKTIGIIIREFKRNDIPFICNRKDLFEVIDRFDVNVIAIPINISFDKILNAVKLCDGIILSGGPQFIENDFLLIEYLYKNDIPSLGICLGMQLMAEYFNNKAEEKVTGHNSVESYVHNIKIDKNSLLYSILKEEVIKVNSRHNDAIPYTSMDVTAYSEDGVIEAVEDKTKKFFIGVQWHPESTLDKYSLALFKSFVDKL